MVFHKNKAKQVGLFLTAAVLIILMLGCAAEILSPNYGTDYIRDYQYAYGRIFDLGRIEKVTDYETIDFHPGDSIVYLEVFISRNSIYEEDIYPEGEFWVDPDDTTLSPGESQWTSVRKVDTSDYFYHSTEFWICFERVNAGSQFEIGAFMIVRRAGGTIDTIGYIQNEPYRLKLIKIRQPTSGMVTWNYEWKNVYNLMQRNISSEVFKNLSITVFNGKNDTEGDESNRSDQGGVPLNLILGLYKTDTLFADSGWQLNPENFWLEHGLLIFPSRRPFDTYESHWQGVTLDHRVPELYDSNNNANKVQSSEYYFEIRTPR